MKFPIKFPYQKSFKKDIRTVLTNHFYLSPENISQMVDVVDAAGWNADDSAGNGISSIGEAMLGEYKSLVDLNTGEVYIYKQII